MYTDLIQKLSTTTVQFVIGNNCPYTWVLQKVSFTPECNVVSDFSGRSLLISANFTFKDTSAPKEKSTYCALLHPCDAYLMGDNYKQTHTVRLHLNVAFHSPCSSSKDIRVYTTSAEQVDRLSANNKDFLPKLVRWAFKLFKS